MGHGSEGKMYLRRYNRGLLTGHTLFPKLGDGDMFMLLLYCNLSLYVLYTLSM